MLVLKAHAICPLRRVPCAKPWSCTTPGQRKWCLLANSNTMDRSVVLPLRPGSRVGLACTTSIGIAYVSTK